MHNGPVTCIDMHEGKGFLLTGSKDSTLKVKYFSLFLSLSLSLSLSLCVNNKKNQLWDMRSSGKCLRTLSGHRDWIKCLYMDSKGEYAYSGSCDTKIKKWNLANGNCELTLSTGRGGTVTSFCFVDGTSLLLVFL